MKVLVIGSGGREHALVWKVRQSPAVERVYCAPGNAGIGEMAELVAIGADRPLELAEFAERERIDLTVVGPELPLTLGIADEFERRGLAIFGPKREAAALEGSKVFAKRLMAEEEIPTADFEVFADAAAARAYVRARRRACVVKADGLAAGKGVAVCASPEEAEAAIERIMVERLFGAAGERVVIEELLQGEEASFMAITDGEHFLPLASSQDHKRAFDGDRGPNTGGMGAYSPAPAITPDLERRIGEEILRPLLRGLRRRGVRYRGVLYAGLMLTESGPKVLEFNARLGDPECQPVMMRLENDLVSLLRATLAGELEGCEAKWREESAVCVVLCSRGYPESFERGREIRGLERLRGWKNGFVFHSGTAREGERWLTAGGRVLSVTALGRDLAEAVAEAYRAVAEIHWEGMHYRRDIGRRGLARSFERPGRG